MIVCHVAPRAVIAAATGMVVEVPAEETTQINARLEQFRPKNSQVRVTHGLLHMPYHYGYPCSAPYVPRLYAGYAYNPGSYSDSVSPYWGTSYYYTNPNFHYWYRFR